MYALTKDKLRDLHNQVYLKYRTQMIIRFEKVNKNDFYSYINSRQVIVPEIIKTQQTEWSLFAFLHEIGHVMTNTDKMKRCEKEYLATKWALKEADNLGFLVPDEYIKIYQDYIWQWRNTSIKLKAKDVPTEEELMLR